MATAPSNLLAQAHRRELSAVSAAVTSGVVSVALGADPAAIDTWFFSALDGLITRIQAGYARSRRSGTDYLRRQATMAGASVDIRTGSLSLDQAQTSMRVTGPVAFKQAIAAGMDEELAVHTMSRRMGGAAQRLTLAGDRDVLEQTMRYGRGVVGYRRVLGGPGCGFCAMLASRGAVYLSEQSASRTKDGLRYHDHCRCGTEPLFAREPESADVLALQRQWRRVTAGLQGDKAAAAWRRYWEGREGALIQGSGSPSVLRQGLPAVPGRGRGAVGIPGVPMKSSGVPGIAGPGGIAVRQVFAEAKTYRELRTAIADEYRRVTGNDLFVVMPSNASLETMREHAEGILRSAELFPEARLDFLGMWDEVSDTYAEAAGSAINFNLHWSSRARRQDYLAALQGDVDRRWHPRGFESPAAAAVHEFGHILDIETLAERIHPQVRRAIERRATILGIEPDTLVAREISGYAGTDFREAVAEAFTDVVLNGPNASVLSREIFDILQAEYRAGGFASGAGGVARAVAAPDLSKLKVAELRALATERGITIPARAKKADIIALLDEGGTARSRAMVPEARVRQATLDRSRSTAELLSEVDELLSNQASVRALRHRIEARAKLGDVPPATVKALLAAVDDPVKLRAAMAKAAKGAKLTPTTPLAGEVVPFDRKLMQSIGDDIADGELVRIVRPGYSAMVDGKRVDLIRGGVFKLDAAEAATFRKAQQRAAARARQEAIARADGTAKLLAEVDELLSKKASAATIRQRLDPALIEPEQLFANADRAVLDALRTALDSGDMAKLRATVTRLTTKAKLKATSKAGAKVKFDPDTMDPVGGVKIPTGAQVVVVTRGSSVVIDGETVVLTKPRVAAVSAPRELTYAARQRELKARTRGVVVDERELGGGFDAEVRLLIYRDGSRVVQKQYGPATSARDRLSAAEAAEQADSEILGARVMEAIGARAPVAIKTGRARGEISMEWVDGRTAAEIPDALARYIDSDDGRLMGLSDFIMTNEDRHAGNWMIDQTGRLVGIDHGRLFFGESISRNDFVDGRFGAVVPRSAKAGHERIPGFASYVMVIDNDMSPSDMAIIRKRLEALRAEFVRAKRLSWFDRMMLRFAEAERHATGTRSRLAT